VVGWLKKARIIPQALAGKAATRVGSGWIFSADYAPWAGSFTWLMVKLFITPGG